MGMGDNIYKNTALNRNKIVIFNGRQRGQTGSMHRIGYPKSRTGTGREKC